MYEGSRLPIPPVSQVLEGGQANPVVWDGNLLPFSILADPCAVGRCLEQREPRLPLVKTGVGKHILCLDRSAPFPHPRLPCLLAAWARRPRRARCDGAGTRSFTAMRHS